MRPLADRLRPQSLDEVAGQQHLLGKNGVLRRIIESGKIPNMVFYGSPGIGKTTVAGIIAGVTNRRLHKLNGTSASIADVKAVVDELGTLMAPEGVLLYLDEIQYFNKKQQQSLLEYMEDGRITLIASTTENPYFYVYGAILSRSPVFEFKPLEPSDVIVVIRRGFKEMWAELGFEGRVSDEVTEHIAFSCGGDVRKALNAVELLASTASPEQPEVTLEAAKTVTQRSAVRYDRDGDSHYDILSAFQKSIRGSDPDAAMHYLARLIAGGDLPSICRRTLVTAAEDIGLAYPQAITIVKACVDSALQLGLPEARIPLAHAVLLLATSPKSNSAICAIDAAMGDLESGKAGDVPDHLKDSHYGGAKKLGHGTSYQYPHSYPRHWTAQQYLPDSLKNAVYYEYGDNKLEQATRRYWDEVRGKKTQE